MCTTEQRDEIIAEILTAHLGMPRRYAAWFVREMTPVELRYVTRAAIAGRKSLVREIQQTVHRRVARERRFPRWVESPPRARARHRRRKLRDTPGQQMFPGWP